MYARIYEQIFSSSIMEEDLETRYVWFCLLTLADKEGFVDITIPAIARRINLNEQAVTKAIEKFMLPDLSSRTPTSDGKRLEKIRDTFGWKIINYLYYRDLRNEDSRREYMRNYMKERRKCKQIVYAKVDCKQDKPLLATTTTTTTTATTTATATTTNIKEKENKEKEKVIQKDNIKELQEGYKSVIQKLHLEGAFKDTTNKNTNIMGKQKKIKTPIPDNFTISDRVKKWAEEKGYINLQEHLESFISKCKAKGYEYVDWDSAFMEAIRGDWAKITLNGGNDDDRFNFLKGDKET